MNMVLAIVIIAMVIMVMAIVVVIMVMVIGAGDVCFFLTMRCFNDAMFSNS